MSLHDSVKTVDRGNKKIWQKYSCSHCGLEVSGAVIALLDHSNTRWLLCPNCYKGSVVVGTVLYPDSKFGPEIEGLPTEIAEAYDEARRCMSVSAYTASELVCRKLLMYIAVDKGAEEGKPFVYYLSSLQSQGYITPPMEGWADLIRQNGNEATHELKDIPRERAESTVMFTAELLRLIYEMEYMKNKYKPES